jgi:hypothetical protein
MCLRTITREFTGTNMKVTRVWKEFIIDRCGDKEVNLQALFFYGIYQKEDWGVWLKTPKTRRKIRTDANPDKGYRAGFHGWKRKPCNNHDNLIPVEFRRIHTLGKQDGIDVYVAYEMRIPKNWKKYIK